MFRLINKWRYVTNLMIRCKKIHKINLKYVTAKQTKKKHIQLNLEMTLKKNLFFLNKKQISNLKYLYWTLKYVFYAILKISNCICT